MLLLRAGANPDAQTSNGTTSLILAIHAGHYGCVRALIEFGAAPSLGTHDQHRPLHEAVAKGHEATVRLLLRGGADPEVYTSRGRTPLHEAARLGHARSVEALLEYGASRESRSRDELQWTAWHFAKQAGQGPTLAALRGAGGDCPRWSPPREPAVRDVKSWLGEIIQRPFFLRSELRQIAGLRVRVRPVNERELIFCRVSEALELIRTHQARAIERMRRCETTIWIPGWLPSFGAYEPGLRACVLSSDYVLASNRSEAEIAGVIVHESVHARTLARVYQTDPFFRARSERLCCEMERDFLARVPGALDLAQSADKQSRLDPIVWSAKEVTRRKIWTLRALLSK